MQNYTVIKNMPFLKRLSHLGQWINNNTQLKMHDYSLNHWPLPAYWVHKYFKNYFNTYLPNRPEKFLWYMMCILKNSLIMCLPKRTKLILRVNNYCLALLSFILCCQIKWKGKKFTSALLSILSQQLESQCLSHTHLQKEREKRGKEREKKWI